jgi:hypothetical protein
MCFACGQVLGGPEQAAPGFDGLPSPDPRFDPPPAGVMAQARPLQDDPNRLWDVGTERPPWEERRRHGFFAALWLTWRDSVFKPIPFFRTLPPRSGLGPAIGYALLMFALALTFNIYWDVLRTALLGGGEEGLAVTILSGLIALFINVLLLVVYLVLLFLFVALLHIGLLMTGSGRMGYEGTFRSVAYSSGPAAFAIFPFFGLILSLVWGTVIVFIAVREVQRTTNGRVAIAFLVPLVASIVFFFIIGILAMIMLDTADLMTI